MWLFTTLGFFSVVHKPEDPPALLTVRARAADDLDRLRALGKACDASVGETLQIPGTDYPFRASIDADGLALIMGALVSEATGYSNFKNAATKVLGHERVKAFHDVWEVMATRYDGDKRWQTDEQLTQNNASSGQKTTKSTSGARLRRSPKQKRPPAQ